MSFIQVKKLKDGDKYIYPLSVDESTVICKPIKVEYDIGSYKKGQTIYPGTTLGSVLASILSGKSKEDNDNPEDNDKLVHKFGNETIGGNKTFLDSIIFTGSDSNIEVKDYKDPTPIIWEIPDEAIDLPDGDLSSGVYKLTSNRNSTITIKSGTSVTLYVGEGVELNSDTDCLYVETGAELNLFSKGTFNSNSTGKYNVVYNEGICRITGGRYIRTSSYYAILNHGELLELTDVYVEVSSGSASLVVSGYYNYKVGKDRYFIQSDKGSLYPTTIINSGTYTGFNSNTIVIRNDGGSTLIVNDGRFIGTGNINHLLYNDGMSSIINGGYWSRDTDGGLIRDGGGPFELGRDGKLEINGGYFIGSGVYWLSLYFTTKFTPPVLNKLILLESSSSIIDIANSNKLLDINNFISPGNEMKLAGEYYVISSIESLNGNPKIKFSNGSIYDTDKGIYIKNIVDGNDPTSAVSKNYVDSNRNSISDVNKSLINSLTILEESSSQTEVISTLNNVTRLLRSIYLNEEL